MTVCPTYDGQALHLVPVDLLRYWRENTACSRECCCTRQEKLTGPRAKNELMGARLVARGSSLLFPSLDMQFRPIPSCLRPFFYGASIASAGPHYDASCCCIRMHQCVHPYVVDKVRAWVVFASHAQMDTASSASTYQTRLWVASDWLLTEQAHGGVRQV